ncbi:MAG: 50S ribosomal protein L30e [Candidatus Asgardarchaeia archaeon]
MIDFSNSFKIALRTGRIILGFERTKKSIIRGNAKLVIIASNAPKDRMEELKYYAKLANVPIYIFEGSSKDLGALCGKPFMVSAMSVEEPGDSNILELVEAE